MTEVGVGLRRPLYIMQRIQLLSQRDISKVSMDQIYKYFNKVGDTLVKVKPRVGRQLKDIVKFQWQNLGGRCKGHYYKILLTLLYA